VEKSKRLEKLQKDLEMGIDWSDETLKEDGIM
jgi:hypothetical protein